MADLFDGRMPFEFNSRGDALSFQRENSLLLRLSH
jgi:hypothetical protein